MALAAQSCLHRRDSMSKADRWKTFGDRREARRLRKAGLWYDGTRTIEGDVLTAEVALLPWIPGRTPRFKSPIVVAPLEWCAWLVRGAMAEFVPAPKTPCHKWAKHGRDAFRWDQNT